MTVSKEHLAPENGDLYYLTHEKKVLKNDLSLFKNVQSNRSSETNFCLTSDIL